MHLIIFINKKETKLTIQRIEHVITLQKLGELRPISLLVLFNKLESFLLLTKQDRGSDYMSHDIYTTCQ